MRMRKKLFNCIREIPVGDKEDEFKRETLFQRGSRIPISKTFYAIVEMDLGITGMGNFPRWKDTFARYSTITVI